ncbi:MAG: RNHCP domain-containing protein [Candidatus Paceibacterales bacterium]
MRKFQRKIEDFVCAHCGAKVLGNGYTNHCPQCLWSKHVDVNPGDRQATCGGLMEPVGIEATSDGYILTQQCQKCGVKKKNRSNANDNPEAFVKLSQTLAKKLIF